MRTFRLFLLASAAAIPASAQDFWAHWGDGRAELNGYRLVQPRYGEKREGTDVLVFVTEDMADTPRVKADPGKHPKNAVYAVMKLNAIRDFQTGIYDYNTMTSTFARVAPAWPVTKISFSSQEWCGHVYHQLLPRGGRVSGVFHSYFDGEADGTEDLPAPKDGVYEDALPILLRGWGGEYLEAGASRTVSFLPSLFRARLEHKRLAWGKATIARSAGTRGVTVPAGTFSVTTWTVHVEGGPRLTFQIEAAPPYRLVRRQTDSGEDASLLGSTRLPYWKLNGTGGEKHLKEIGLKVPSAR